MLRTDEEYVGRKMMHMEARSVSEEAEEELSVKYMEQQPHFTVYTTSSLRR